MNKSLFSHLILLFFQVISLNETQGNIERLSFVNHTECHCVEKSKQPAAEYAVDHQHQHQHQNQHQQFGGDGNSHQWPYLQRATILNCNCPNQFEKILQEDGHCRCDCSSGNIGCDWLKRGMEHFSVNDRK